MVTMKETKLRILQQLFCFVLQKKKLHGDLKRLFSYQPSSRKTEPPFIVVGIEA